MPAKSKSQQRLFGMVYAYKDGKLDLNELDDSLAKKIKDIAEDISKKDAKKYASTEHDELPEKVEESSKIKRFEEYIKESNDDKPEGYMDALEGGEAEGMTIEDVAEIHNVPVQYIKSIMPIGIEIELEHTEDEEVAARIALDHLAESPLYYDNKIGLPEMEEELEELEDDEIEDIIKDRIKKFDEFESDDVNDDSDEKEKEED
ncbi:MAG: DUF5661 family protein [bacterium]